jgi:ABC-type multidrug transport system ATPase subunit
MPPILEMKNLSRHFERAVLRDLNLVLEEGERVALLGQNGSGKTTLLRILATLITPSKGEAWVCGHSILSEPQAVRALIGWAPASDNGFFDRLTGLENLRFFGSLLRLSDKEIERRIEPLGKLEPLRAAFKIPFGHCSTGMKHCLVIARTLLTDPALLFLDEPTRSLDTTASNQVREALRSITPDKTVLFTTHLADEAQSLSTRTVKLEGGAFVA